MVKERRSEEELRRMMLAAARKHEECSELEDLFIFGPTPRLGANWGFGVAGKENKVSVACYTRLDQIASNLQEKYELPPVKGARRDIEARVWSLVHDQPTLKASLSRSGALNRRRRWASPHTATIMAGRSGRLPPGCRRDHCAVFFQRCVHPRRIRAPLVDLLAWRRA